MSFLISAVKRKVDYLTSFVTGQEKDDDTTTTTNDESSRPAKRNRLNGSSTPMLHYSSEESPNLIVESLITTIPSALIDDVSSPKESKTINGSGNSTNNNNIHQTSNNTMLRLLPPHVLSKCLSFLSTRSDRFALQTTCTLFRKLSNEDDMLANVDVGGRWPLNSFSNDVLAQDNEDERQYRQLDRVEVSAASDGGDEVDADDDIEEEDRYVLEMISDRDETGTGGILTESDTTISACRKLIKFASAGNMQATCMLAMILCYCHENVSEGLTLLRHAAMHGDLRSIYNLALILRDTRPTEANHWLYIACRYNYIPAWQEKLTPTEMRVRFGDLDASTLSSYLDPPCLSRLLGKHYLESKRAEHQQTSHCWNPMCGRWAYKATSRAEQRRRNQRDENDEASGSVNTTNNNPKERFSIRHMLPELPNESIHQNHVVSPLGKIRHTIQYRCYQIDNGTKVSRMKMCSSCRRAKFCSKLCQVYDWRSGRHKAECPHLNL